MKNAKKIGARAPSKSAMVALSALAASLLLASPAAYAEAGADAAARGIDAPAPDGSGRVGAYLAVPVYLYGKYSASGLQLGRQMGNFHLRIDLSVIAEFENGEQVLFANPSLGAFLSHEWGAGIRSYEGIAIGVETGLMNSFEGQVCILNAITGAEFFLSRRKALYIELGSGLAILPKEGAFNGGTLIGGGMKYFL